MASYNELNALIDAYINRNGVQAITGQILNGVLKAVVEQIGRGYALMGIASPNGDPGTPDAPESYFASEPGTYTNFGGRTVAPGEFALLYYIPSEGWFKETIYDGFQTVGATIDGNVGTPSVGVSYADGVLSFDFHNMKGNPGQNGQDGDPAGFGTIGADIAGGVGTPGVTVESSGPATAKNLQFHFTNLKGETGVTSVVATVDNTTGNPACTVSLVGQQLTLAFSGLKGAQGDTGSSVDYPFTIVNNLTTNDATQALSAAMGVQLESEIGQLEAEVNGNNFDETVVFSLVSGTGIETTSAAGSLPLESGETYKLDISNNRANGTRITFYLYDDSGNKVNMKVSYNEADLPGEPTVNSRTVGSATTELYLMPLGAVDRLKIYAPASDVKDTIDLSFEFVREGQAGLVSRVQDVEGDVETLGQDLAQLQLDVSDIDGDVQAIEQGLSDVETDVAKINYKFLSNDLSGVEFSAEYLIWTLSGDNVIAGTSSYNNQRVASYVPVKEGDVINITQSILGTARKAIFANDSDVMVAVVTYTETVTNYIVPQNATRLYINREVGSEFSFTVQSSDSVKLETLLENASTTTYKLPIYSPLPQPSADGQNGTLDAENSTSMDVFSKCDAVVAKYRNYATGEVVGTDATNTYDIKRYFLCRANLFAWRASNPWYAWKTGSTTRFIQSATPVVGMPIYGASLSTVVATVTVYNCNTGTMNDSNGSSYTREKTSDIPADIIYTDKQTFTYSFSVYRKDGSVRDGLPKTAWDSENNTIAYNSLTYARSRKDDWSTNCKETIVIWANEHAAQSDPHECAVICYRLLRDLCESGPSANKFLSYLKNYCKLIILPVVNPYGFNGYATSKNAGGRLNGNGVNINRNYPTTGWSSGSVGSDYGGTYGGSEKETQYVINTVIEFDASVGIDLHCLGYIGPDNEGICAYGGNFDGDNEQVKEVANSMLADFDITLSNYGASEATGNGSGKNWLLANGIEGGLIEMNAGPYSAQYDGNQHSGFILGADYTLLLRMLNMWNLRFSEELSLNNFNEM